MDAADIDHNFESQSEFRARSNTWPLRPIKLEPPNGSPASEDSNQAADVHIKQEKGDPLGLTAKKSGSRRNAWGNLSYADLITKAIQSSPEKRLTLSQIYDWMVQNVPYFKDKGDSTSSAGWKNSIRHNLSLHSRFMRIQNEGTGKSSWWVINPDAKPGKAPRRRAGSMETKSYEKKRGRVKKKVEALRAALENGASPLGGEDYLDPLAFSDFRPRTSSNASSCGRLSPIHAGIEPDLHDNQVPPMSPIPWGAEVDDSQRMYQGGEKFSDLVESLVGGMKLSGQESIDMGGGLGSDSYGVSSNGDFTASMPPNFLEINQYPHLPAPPPYPDHSPPPPTAGQPPPPSQRSPLERSAFNNSYPNIHHSLNNGYSQPARDMYGEPLMDHLNSPPSQMCSQGQPPLNSPDRSQQNSPNPQGFASHLSPQTHHRSSPQQRMSPLNHQLSPQQTRALLGGEGQHAGSPGTPLSALQQQQASASILRDALTRGHLQQYGQPVTTDQYLAMTMSPATTATSNGMNMVNMGLSPHHQIHQQQQLQQQQQLRMSCSMASNYCGVGVINNMPPSSSSSGTGGAGLGSSSVPLDIDMDNLISVDYDMDQVIKQELRLEGSLDFNFDNIASAPSASTTAAASHNIIH